MYIIYYIYVCVYIHIYIIYIYMYLCIHIIYICIYVYIQIYKTKENGSGDPAVRNWPPYPGVSSNVTLQRPFLSLC